MKNSGEKYDVIIVGTGFASSFFLSAYLQIAGAKERILVLERGKYDSHEWQLENRSSSSIPYNRLYINRYENKKWHFAPGFGGGSKIWWGCTPRLLPNDFRLKTAYGVGKDWPLGYDDLEKYYCRAEEIMSISGPENDALFPRSRPYPQPPHLLSDPDKILQKHYPDLYFPQPTARSRIATAKRNNCCVAGVCDICPVDAKFTILNGLDNIYRDSRVTLELNAEVKSVGSKGNIVTSIEYFKNEKTNTASAQLIVLGASSLFNPFILLKSGFDHPMLGKNLNEQISKYAIVELDGIDNLQGSTSITANGYMLYDGAHRSERAACLMESYNIAHLNGLRNEKGKWRQRMRFKFIFEVLPNTNNFVKISDDDQDKPETVYSGFSKYTKNIINKLPDILPNLLSPLPVEKIEIADDLNVSDGHIIGTTVMGDDPETSVVDKDLKHHKFRNLMVLGSGSFPTCPPANPALTISALSLRAVDYL